MRLFVYILLFSHFAFSEELRFDLSKSEVKKVLELNAAKTVEESLANFYKNFQIDVIPKFNQEKRQLLCSGSKSDLIVAEYLFLSLFKDIPEITLKFTYFAGSPKNRQIKRRFEKRLKANKSNVFQYSNRLIDGEPKDINGFTFDLAPKYDVFQKSLLFHISLSYKNEEKVIGDKGAQVLDLNTSIRMDPGKEVILKITDKNDPGWEEDSYLSFILNSNFKSTYFEKCLPDSLKVKEGFYLQHAFISKGLMSAFNKNPVDYLRRLGVPFPSGSFAAIHGKSQLLFVLNSKENLELFDTIGSGKSTAFHDNIEWGVTIYESNLIIKDPDKLQGHTLQKVTSFACICTQNYTYTFSKRFNGNYESVVYMDALMPAFGEHFNYNVILKREGPKLKAKNYKFEAFFGKNKKYRVPLDKYHFMEVSVEK